MLDTAVTMAARAHDGQRRKYTGEPYITHCLEVVSILMRHGIKDKGDGRNMLAAAMLHDVMEDTPLDYRWMLSFLRCYGDDNASRVCTLVRELTEPERQGNRATRKAVEAQRLSMVSPEAQTIKYADLISNTSSITQHDPDFARIYLQEKWNILKVMRAGDETLLNYALIVCEEAADELGLELH